MEENQWVKNQLRQLEKESQDYKQKALLQETLALLLEQEKREEQLKGELDGTLWSPGNWSS
ncbi:hypothetical protein [Alkalibacterium kapii]|uniref:Uncharacterized protein n=1 Tax=Alkalibacterium kapii TaxID=426704 RepID=A0A511AW74_9LACT|nr:hypothetical protein [Alkalibacterium kapii]GEK91882.1 hypothetical protein AKA01nite_15040 [Alkalibacterium kapii]